MNVTNKGSTPKTKQGSHKPLKKLSSAGIGSWGGGQTTDGEKKALAAALVPLSVTCLGSQFGTQSIITGKAAGTGGRLATRHPQSGSRDKRWSPAGFPFSCGGSPSWWDGAAIQGGSSQLQK